MRGIAERLVAYETRGNKYSAQPTAAFLLDEKLRPHLAALMGKGGFSALLSRALALAKLEVPWLRAVHFKADNSLEVPEKLDDQIDPEKLFEGRVVLLAQLLGLLVDFVGENLTLRLVREVWPKLPLDDFDFDESDKK